MNLTLDGETSESVKSDVQFINFNQDYSSIAIGTKSGYSLYSLENDNVEKLQRIFHEEEHTDICIIERLKTTSLVVIVSLLSPRKLRLFNIRERREIDVHSYTNTILAIKLNRERLIICLEDQLYIQDLRNGLTVKWVIKNIPPNPNGLFALSPNPQRCYLAYPASQHSGEVQIFDALELRNKILIPSHDNPLAALSFNQEGNLLASASDKGTVIRVHSVEDGQCMYEFRRGYARCVDIYSLAFSLDSNFLAASSSTETVHIFKLDQSKLDDQQSSLANQTTWSGYLNRALVTSSSYLSGSISDALNQWRSFATCRLPFRQLKNVCAIRTIGGQPRVMVVSSEGYLYIYNMDLSEGGDCVLVRQHRLEDEEDSLDHRDINSTIYPPSSNANNSQHHHNQSSSSGASSSASHRAQSNNTTLAFANRNPQSATATTNTTTITATTASNNNDLYSRPSLNSMPPIDTTHHYDNDFPPLEQPLELDGSPTGAGRAPAYSFSK